MSQSQHQQIVEAYAALLTAGTPLAGGRVFEGRDMPLGSDVESQIHVFMGDSNAVSEIITGAPVDWQSEVEFVVRARRSGSSSAEKIADSLLCEVVARVMAASSASGLVMGLDPISIARDRDQADPNVAAFTWRVSAIHRTTQNSLA